MPLIIRNGGTDEDRTRDPHNAIVVLSQLSYSPVMSRISSGILPMDIIPLDIAF